MVGCGPGGRSADQSPGSARTPTPSPAVTLAQPSPAPREQVASALVYPDAPNLPDPLVDPAEILSGGPPPDGIPAIDHPRFLRAGDVDFLEDREPVLAVHVGAEA